MTVQFSESRSRLKKSLAWLTEGLQSPAAHGVAGKPLLRSTYGGSSTSGCAGSHRRRPANPSSASSAEGLQVRLHRESPAAAGHAVRRDLMPPAIGNERVFEFFSDIMGNRILTRCCCENTNLPFQLISQPVPSPQIFGSGPRFRFFVGSFYFLTIGSGPLNGL